MALGLNGTRIEGKGKGRGEGLHGVFTLNQRERRMKSAISKVLWGTIQPDTEELPHLFALLGHPICSIYGKLPLELIYRTSLASGSLLL